MTGVQTCALPILNVQTSEVGVGWIDIATHSVHRGRGIGGALYDVAERHLREVGTRRILTESRADAASIAFAQSRGFAQIPSNDILRLDPRTVRAMSLPTGVDVVPFNSFLDDPAEAVPRRRHRDAR